MTVVKVVLTSREGALRRRLVDRLRAGGHDPRPLSDAPLPAGAELRDALGDAGAVVHVAGGLHGPADADLDDTRRVARAAAATGTHLVLVVPGPIAAVEAVLESAGEGWTLQPTTNHARDVAEWLAALRIGPVLPVPRSLLLQPIDPGDVADRLEHLLRAGPAGRVPAFGGPEVRRADDLARAWLRAGGRHGAVVPTDRVAIPAGVMTFPDRAVGRTTWDEWLRDLRQQAPDRGEEPVGAE
jgi:hypothetical protein